MNSLPLKQSKADLIHVHKLEEDERKRRILLREGGFDSDLEEFLEHEKEKEIAIYEEEHERMRRMSENSDVLCDSRSVCDNNIDQVPAMKVCDEQERNHEEPCLVFSLQEKIENNKKRWKREKELVISEEEKERSSRLGNEIWENIKDAAVRYETRGTVIDLEEGEERVTRQNDLRWEQINEMVQRRDNLMNVINAEEIERSRRIEELRKDNDTINHHHVRTSRCEQHLLDPNADDITAAAASKKKVRHSDDVIFTSRSNGEDVTRAMEERERGDRVHEYDLDSPGSYCSRLHEKNLELMLIHKLEEQERLRRLSESHGIYPHPLPPSIRNRLKSLKKYE